MNKERITNNDERYIIFYSFDEEREHETGNETEMEHEAEREAMHEAEREKESK